MRKLIRSLIIAVVLVVPSLAWAECAWVLWRSPIPKGAQRPYPLEQAMIDSAWESKRDCEARIDRWVKDAVSQGSFALRPRDGGSPSEILPNEGQGPGTLLICLPDTIDPRGPKGGTR